MDPIDLLATLLFSETKDMEDAISISHVVLNRMKRPQRFGESLEDVIYAPKQFSGVNSNEWNKVIEGKLTPKEQEIYNSFRGIAEASIIGAINDPTEGADHYFNPKISNPSWAKEMTEVYKTPSHTYYKE